MGDLGTLLEQSREIAKRAISEFEPRAVVAMVSGGDDSLTAYHVASALGIKMDFIIHGRTGTGILETTEFVQSWAQGEPSAYIEADAGTLYEQYVLRKGFFGRGHKPAHMFCYHVIKAGPFRKAISSIRQRRRNYRVLLINGVRESESDNRRGAINDTNLDPSARSNIWLNIIRHWSKADCREFLGQCEARRNPVTELLCRSGECMCGTMQSVDERKEAAFWYPKWGRWIDGLEAEVVRRHGFGWGEDVPSWFAAKKRRDAKLVVSQLGTSNDFLPMCQDCSLAESSNE